MKIKNDIVSCKTCIYRTLLFGCLDDLEYTLVNNARKEVFYSAGEVIINEGDPVLSFLYLRKGLVKLYRTDRHGKERILSINKPGDFISLLHIFSNEAFKYSITALENTLVCDVDLSVIHYLIMKNSEFAMTVIKRMGKISDDIIENRFSQAQRHMKGKIAAILLFFSEEIYHNNIFKLPVTRREIGELVSITTENTIRTLSSFHRDGIINIDGKKITIVDKDRLKKIKENG